MKVVVLERGRGWHMLLEVEGKTTNQKLTQQQAEALYLCLGSVLCEGSTAASVELDE